MKRPVLLTFAVIFTVAALAVLGVLVMSLSGRIDMGGFFKSGFKNATSGELIKEETFDASALTDLNISTRDQRIEFILTNEDFITVRQYDNIRAEPFSATQTADSLSIELMLNVQIAILDTVIPRLEIYVPRTYAGDVSATSTSGGIACEDAITWNAVQLNSKSGSIRFEQSINCDTLRATSTSGSVRLGELAVGGGMQLASSSGSIRVDGNIRCDALAAEASSGAISLGDVSIAGNAALTTKSGSIRVGALTAQSYTISASSGSVKIASLTGKGTATTGSGSISCDALNVTGDTHFQASSGAVRVTMGDVKNLNFEITSGSGSHRTGGYNFMYDKTGKKGSCTIGDGSTGTLSIKTSSGSIVIN